MRGWSLLSLLVVVLALAVAVGSPVLGLSPDGAGPGGTADADSGTVDIDGEQHGSALQGDDVDQVVMEVALRPDGSAVWRVEHRVRLDDDTTAAGFEETRGRIETDREAFLGNFTERVRAMATTAEADTGRVMVVENVSVTARREQLPQEYGIITYEFRWYGFAETDGKLRAGDALAGLFLDGETTLLVSWPDNATLAEVSPEPDDRRDGAVVWEGPLEFASGEPTVVLESESLSFGPGLVWDASSSDMFLTLGLLLLVAGLVGTGGVALRRRRAREEPGETAGQSAGETPGEETTASEGPVASEAATDEEATGEATDTEGAVDDSPPEELLSNEERVLALLEERGGRVKQQDVVEALDWSETKTSEVVSELRESDRIDVYRIGRNNVLALPETGIGYEFDDENGGGEA